MVGLPGSGKSTLAKKISFAFECVYLSSDFFRDYLAGQSRYVKAENADFKNAREYAYELMYKMAVGLVVVGEKVVLDATHLESNKREIIVTKLLSVTSPQRICYVVVDTPYEVIKTRMSAAQTNNAQLFQDWERVYSIFTAKEHSGNLTWPSKISSHAHDAIECVSYSEIEELV